MAALLVVQSSAFLPAPVCGSPWPPGPLRSRNKAYPVCLLSRLLCPESWAHLLKSVVSTVCLGRSQSNCEEKTDLRLVSGPPQWQLPLTVTLLSLLSLPLFLILSFILPASPQPFCFEMLKLELPDASMALPENL